MTPTLKEQLEQWIELEASNRFKSHQLMTAHLYKAGAHSILPMLVVALDCVEGIKNEKLWTGSNVYAFADNCKYDCEEALNKIKSMMEGNGND